MFTTRAGQTRVLKNPYVSVEAESRARAGDTLTRFLNSEAVTALLGVLTLLFAIDIALVAAVALSR